MQITKELLVNALDDDRAVFETLRNAPVFRSFPTTKHLTVPAANVLRKVLQDREISCNLEDSGIKLCCEMGWIHSDHAAQSSSLAPDIICFLPSRLHEKYFPIAIFTRLVIHPNFSIDMWNISCIPSSRWLSHSTDSHLSLTYVKRYSGNSQGKTSSQAYLKDQLPLHFFAF